MGEVYGERQRRKRREGVREGREGGKKGEKEERGIVEGNEKGRESEREKVRDRGCVVYGSDESGKHMKELGGRAEDKNDSLSFFFSFLSFFLLCGIGGVATPASQWLRCSTCRQLSYNCHWT